MHKKILLHPAVFPSLSHCALMLEAEKIVFEINDHFEKQTYRNRYYIHGAHGKQMLSVPVRHGKSNTHRPTKDVEIANVFDWQRQHWKSLETAYRTSPYFEFYEDDIKPLFEKSFDKLIDFNMETIRKVFELLDWPIDYGFTNTYEKEPKDVADFRFLVNAKKEFSFKKQMPEYYQLFSDRNGFLPDLSILDLLFMKGPETPVYLKEVVRLITI